MTGSYSCTLQRVNSKENQYRFYAVHVTPSLFNDWILVREWGRIGSGGTIRSDVFTTEAQALQKMDTILRDKKKKGYKVLS